MTAMTPDSGPALSAPPYTWRYPLGVAREHKRNLILANIIALLAVVAGIPVPLLMPLLVDEVLLDKPGFMVATMNDLFPVAWHGPVLYIGAVLLLTICLRVTYIAMNVLQTREFTLVAKEITYRIRRTLLERLERVSMGEYETLGSGTVNTHFVTDINVIDEFIGESISKLLVAILSLIAVTMVLLWIHWPLALFILFVNPAVIYFTIVLGTKVKSLKSHENQAFEIFQQALTETLDAIHEIRAANRERHYLLDVADKARGIKVHAAAYAWKTDAANRFSFGIFLIGFDVFRAVSMLMVVFSDLTIGQMLAVFAYLWFMMAPVQEVLNIQYAYFSARGALERINRLFALKAEPRYPHLKDPFRGKTTVGIRVEHVSFAYGNGAPVLNDVDLSIDRGEKIALVGASGGGKSTLVQVILGMYVPQRGQVLFDGIPTDEIGLDVVRDNVATVLQHPAMLNDSVRANLTLGRDIHDARLWRALEVAQLSDVVAALPMGLDTMIGRRGLRLSGGQQQRLAVARMVLADPKVVILDEATSALDNTTEAALYSTLRECFHDRTTLLIAHRLSAVRQADRVYVFEDGHIVEQGSHETLIATNGLYHKLYSRQGR